MTQHIHKTGIVEFICKLLYVVFIFFVSGNNIHSNHHSNWIKYYFSYLKYLYWLIEIWLLRKSSFWLLKKIFLPKLLFWLFGIIILGIVILYRISNLIFKTIIYTFTNIFQIHTEKYSKIYYNIYKLLFRDLKIARYLPQSKKQIHNFYSFYPDYK